MTGPSRSNRRPRYAARSRAPRLMARTRSFTLASRSESTQLHASTLAVSGQLRTERADDPPIPADIDQRRPRRRPTRGLAAPGCSAALRRRARGSRRYARAPVRPKRRARQTRPTAPCCRHDGPPRQSAPPSPPLTSPAQHRMSPTKPPSPACSITSSEARSNHDHHRPVRTARVGAVRILRHPGGRSFAPDALEVVTAYGIGRGNGFHDSDDFVVTRCQTCAQIRSAGTYLLRAHRECVPQSAATRSRCTASNWPSMLSTRLASPTRASSTASRTLRVTYTLSSTT